MKSLDPRVGVAIAVIAVGLLAGVLVYSLSDGPADRTVTAPEATSVASVDETVPGAPATTPATTAPPASTGSGSAGAAAAVAISGDGDQGADSPAPSTTPGKPATSGDSWDGGTIADPKASLSVEQRQECYWKLVEAEYRAIAEAEEAFPQEVEEADYDAHYEMRFRLTDQYQAEIGKAYNLSFEGVVAILVEGAESAWPVPPLTE